MKHCFKYFFLFKISTNVDYRNQFKVTYGGVFLICGMILHCAGTLKVKTWLETGPITADLTTTVVHTCSYKSLINDFKPIHSLHVHVSAAWYFGVLAH